MQNPRAELGFWKGYVDGIINCKVKGHPEKHSRVKASGMGFSVVENFNGTQGNICDLFKGL